MTEQNITHENADFAESFVPAFGDFVKKLEDGTLNDLPRVSEGLKKWQKWADEVEAEN